MYLHFVIFTMFSFLKKKNQWNKYSTKLRINYISLIARDPNLSLDRVSLNHIKANSMWYGQFSGLNSDSIKT